MGGFPKSKVQQACAYAIQSKRNTVGDSSQGGSEMIESVVGPSKRVATHFAGSRLGTLAQWELVSAILSHYEGGEELAFGFLEA